MPVYNGGHYFELALQSALAQTYDNFEIVIVNDGSRDGGATHEVCLRYLKTYPELIQYHVQENTGVGGALNHGIRKMKGDIFCWLSHDDIYLPEKTQVQVEHHARLGERADVALFSDFSLIDDAGKVIGIERADHAALVRNPRWAFYDGHINGCTIYAPREMLIAAGGFDESLRHVQDYAMWRSMLRSGALIHVPETLVRVRMHPSQGSRSPDATNETERFWSDTLFCIGDVEAGLVNGATEMFLRKRADFLRYRSPNMRAAAEALKRADVTFPQTLVSVILDAGADAEITRASAASVLNQTHFAFELVLVGTAVVLGGAPITRLAGDARVTTYQTDDPRLTARLRLGALRSRGSYLAFLSSGDRFEPEKIEVQGHAMSASGNLLSHTSYTVTAEGATAARAGAFTGWVYPEILSATPPALSTIMAHRALVASGTILSRVDDPVELSWVDVAARHPLLGLDMPLSVFCTHPANDGRALLERLQKDPLHSRHSSDIARLDRRMASAFQPVADS